MMNESGREAENDGLCGGFVHPARRDDKDSTAYAGCRLRCLGRRVISRRGLGHHCCICNPLNTRYR